MTQSRPLWAELMSGPSGVMDWCSPPRMKLMTVFLIVSTYIVCLHGNPVTDVKHSLRCVNDYLLTINCSLSITPSAHTSGSNSSYWLTFIETFELEKFVCTLTNTEEDYFCSVKKPILVPDHYYAETFVDLDTFEISLCHNQNIGSETCEVLDEEYTPVTNIKPNAPCCLTVSHNSSQHHFTWKSTYEAYSPFTGLVDNLKYQLDYYKRGDKHNVISCEINTNSMSFSVDDEKLVPDSEYAARVRSSPNQAFYKGNWSDWSPEFHWKTDSGVNGQSSPKQPAEKAGLAKVFIPLCVMVPLVLLLCYAPVKKWRQSAFIPTPAPYFHTLYNECQGDFKSWVVTLGKTADVLEAEETLQIDTLTKCTEIQKDCQPQFHHQLSEGSTYSNVSDPGCDTFLMGTPYAVSTMAPPSAAGSSLNSLILSSQSGSPAEGDSGCWLCSPTSLGRDRPFYCNEYCTLSAFQQSSPDTAEHHRSL